MASDILFLPAPLDADSAARREILFHEPLAARLRRIALGAAWAVKPPRHAGLPRLARFWLEHLLADADAPALPSAEAAGNDPLGLCGIADDLSPETLVEAYRRGLYPFAHIEPQKWLSPPERSVLYFAETHIAKRLRRQLRQGQYTVTFDRDFEAVVMACAGRRRDQWQLSWLTPRMMQAYATLFDLGYVHSFEVWNAERQLVGGGYGIAIGGAFSTESQFSIESNTSKIGFTVLNYHLARWGFAFNDGKLMTPTCQDMGFRLIPRSTFCAEIEAAAQLPLRPGRWQVEADLATVAAWDPAAPAG